MIRKLRILSESREFLTRLAMGVLLLTTCPGTSFAAVALQDDPGMKSRNSYKKDISFDQLPGKGGLLRPGFRFRVGDYPELTGFIVKNDNYEVAEYVGGIGVMRTLILVRPPEGREDKTDRIIVEIQVDPFSTDNAQEGIVTMLMQSNYAAVGGPLLQRGDRVGISVGDFNFIPPRGKAVKPELAMITFVRNNVRVLLHKRRAHNVDLAVLARKMDGAIKNLPAMDGTQLRANHIPTATLTPEKSTIHGGEMINVTLQAADPHGLKLIQLENVSGGILDQRAANPANYRFRGTDGTGDTGVMANISIFAVNEGGLFSEAKTTVFVSPKDQ
jgi:hypothetical protein